HRERDYEAVRRLERLAGPRHQGPERLRQVAQPLRTAARSSGGAQEVTMVVDVFVLAPDGTTRSQRVDLAKTGLSAIVVGRRRDCTLPLEGEAISRQHARITLGEGAIRVEDISSNWTMAGETVLRRQSLDVAYGTPLVIGNYTLQIFPAQNQP